MSVISYLPNGATANINTVVVYIIGTKSFDTITITDSLGNTSYCTLGLDKTGLAMIYPYDTYTFTSSSGYTYTQEVGDTSELYNEETERFEIVTFNPISLTLGNTYTFGGYDWTCAEDKDGYYVLQSQGVTADTWNNLFNSATTNQDGVDCHSRNTVLNTLYSNISYAEKTGAEYGSGLFLVSNSKCGTTTDRTQGSGNYWSALKTSAINYKSFGSGYPFAIIGTVTVSSASWSIGNDGIVYNNNTASAICVIAPAFNLDKTKVRLEGSNDIVAIDAPERLYLYNLGDECVDVTGGGSADLKVQILKVVL